LAKRRITIKFINELSTDQAPASSNEAALDINENVLALSQYVKGMALIAKALENPFVFENVDVIQQSCRAVSHYVDFQLPAMQRALGIEPENG